MYIDKKNKHQAPAIAKLQELIDNLGKTRKTAKYSKLSSKGMETVCQDNTMVSVADDKAYIDIKQHNEDFAEVRHAKSYGKAKRVEKRSVESELRFTTSEQVYDYALNLLIFRDYSRAEMLAKLVKKGAQENLAQCAVTKLAEYNFLNEERYAFRVYEMWLGKRVYGRNHLQAELRKRSIERECIVKIMETFTAEQEAERAEAAANLFLQQHKKKLQELDSLSKEEDFAESDNEELCAPSVKQRHIFKGGRSRSGGLGRAAERMAALKKLQSAAGRFMAARGFSGRYMHILLEKLRNDNDM